MCLTFCNLSSKSYFQWFTYFALKLFKIRNIFDSIVIIYNYFNILQLLFLFPQLCLIN
jgi:hypothetical protein